MTVDEAIGQARCLGVDRLDAQLLLAHHVGRSRSWVIAHGDDTLEAGVAAAYDADCARRRDDVPLAYLVGEKEFHRLCLKVTPSVLVPRPETETLVEWAIELLSGCGIAAPEVVDLGTGSGAIALAVGQACPAAYLTATDVDAAALDLARRNASLLGRPTLFAPGCWWDAVGGRRFHLALSNPPYIADGDPHLHALRHEPPHALRAGPDGLAAIRRIVADAPRHLHAGAWLLLEHGAGQSEAVASLLCDRGFVDVATRADLGDRPRCTGGRWADHASR